MLNVYEYWKCLLDVICVLFFLSPKNECSTIFLPGARNEKAISRKRLFVAKRLLTQFFYELVYEAWAPSELIESAAPNSRRGGANTMDWL